MFLPPNFCIFWVNRLLECIVPSLFWVEGFWCCMAASSGEVYGPAALFSCWLFISQMSRERAHSELHLPPPFLFSAPLDWGLILSLLTYPLSASTPPLTGRILKCHTRVAIQHLKWHLCCFGAPQKRDLSIRNQWVFFNFVLLWYSLDSSSFLCSNFHWYRPFLSNLCSTIFQN